MFKINKDGSIEINRGDWAEFAVTAKKEDGSDYTFVKGDIVRFKVYEKSDSSSVKAQKDIEVTEDTTAVVIELTNVETEICQLATEAIDFCYEVKLNPDTCQKTIIGHDKKGAKIFRVYPEGGDLVV